VHINKSRYASVSRYLSTGPNVSGKGCQNNSASSAPKGLEFYKPEYNDLEVAVDESIFDRLIDNGICY
jgi:hypothetical protein